MLRTQKAASKGAAFFCETLLIYIMSVESEIRQIVHDIRYQLPPAPTTMGFCDCGGASRGSRKCCKCLQEALAQIVRPELAAQFVEAAAAARYAESALYDDLSIPG